MKSSVAIIGAGPMGLAAAFQLAKDGHTPVIFEGADRIGGMTATFDFGGLNVERYYHFHCTSDLDFMSLLEELGISNKLRWKATKMGFFYKNILSAWGNPLALLTFPGVGLVSKIRYGIHAFYCIKLKNWKKLDGIESTAWIRRWIGDEGFKVWWEKLFEFKFYNYASSLSAAWIWSRIRRIGTSRYNLFQEKLGYLEGGSETFLAAMRAYIEARGGEFRLEEPVLKIAHSSGFLSGLKTTKGSYEFHKIISTIPLCYIPSILPDLQSDILELFKAQRSIAVVCVIMKLKRQVTENFWVNINDENMDIPGMVEYSNLRPLDCTIVYVPYYLPSEHPKYSESDDIFASKVKSFLMKINPSLLESDFLDVKCNRYKYAQPICGPNFLDSLPPYSLPIKGLMVADTTYYYPEDRGISESIGFGRKLAREIVGAN
jgi:protoporphyrinogen oxidase